MFISKYSFYGGLLCMGLGSWRIVPNKYGSEASGFKMNGNAILPSSSLQLLWCTPKISNHPLLVLPLRSWIGLLFVEGLPLELTSKCPRQQHSFRGHRIWGLLIMHDSPPRWGVNPWRGSLEKYVVWRPTDEVVTANDGALKMNKQIKQWQLEKVLMTIFYSQKSRWGEITQKKLSSCLELMLRL